MSPLALAPEELTARFRDGLGAAVVDTSTAFGMATVVVGADAWVDALAFAKSDSSLACDSFSWLSAIEWVDEAGAEDDAGTAEAAEPTAEAEADAAGDAEADDAAEAEAAEAEAAEAEEEAAVAESDYRPAPVPSFEVVARVASSSAHHGVTIKARLDLDRPSVATVIGVYAGANWHERELMEMFGVDVVGHPNPVKLYLPDHFEGHPLRRSYKLGSREVKPWPGEVNVEDMPEDTPVTAPKPGQPK